MPSNRNLDFAEVQDFTPGYFSVGDWLMPPNGSQEMLDCRPDPGGGLRAAVKPTAFSSAGLASGKVAGIFTHSMGTQTPGTVASDRYVAIATSTQTKVYRWNDTTSVAPTVWTLIGTYDGSNGAAVAFDTFVDASGFTHVLWSIGQATATTDNGLYSLQFSYQAGQGVSAIDNLGITATRSVAHRYVDFVSTLAVQDDRIMLGTGGIGAYTIAYSDSQSVSSFPAPNTLKVQASRDGNGICSITPYAPSDLLIGTAFSAWTLVQGDITDSVVRTMSNEKTMGFPQRTPQTPAGLAFIAHRAGVYGTSGGDSFTALSDQIHPNTWAESSLNGAIGPGTVCFGENILVAPHGLFYDFRTHGWHRSSVLTGANDHFHSHYDTFTRQYFVATGSTTPSFYLFDAYETPRWNTYTWKGAPLHRPDGRQVEVREVQVYAKAYDASATVAVTVNGTTKTVTFAAAGRQQLNFLFSERAEVLDVQIVSTAASSSIEAPSIEVVRIGSQSRHTLR